MQQKYQYNVQKNRIENGKKIKNNKNKQKSIIQERKKDIR